MLQKIVIHSKTKAMDLKFQTTCCLQNMFRLMRCKRWWHKQFQSSHKKKWNFSWCISRFCRKKWQSSKYGKVSHNCRLDFVSQQKVFPFYIVKINGSWNVKLFSLVSHFLVKKIVSQKEWIYPIFVLCLTVLKERT